MRSFIQVVCAAVLVVPSFVLAADKNPAFTSAKEAGVDFVIQGEYVGKAQADDGETPFGCQVIALGDGKFQVVGFKGGLPGDGWSRGDEVKRFDAEATKDGRLDFEAEGANIVLEDGTITINVDGNKIGELKKTERKSPTLNAKPPEGATVLFDGSEESLKNFENGQLVEGNLLGPTNCASKKKLGDHTLHIEFRTPFMPKARGQARGNSGVYIQGRYECQVLDSFGLEGKNNECGGIYSISEPAVNMCLPPLSWQTYDIDFTAARYEGDKKVKNARATIKHNGVVIHDDLELTHGTPGRNAEGPGPDALFLQNHGNPVAFRNIWVVEK